MDRVSRKTLDMWLNDKGFYRKHIATDETCLFRAVSDQIYSSQIYHEDIRKQCIKFAKNNRKLLQEMFYDVDLDEHLKRLEKHLAVCGDIEIQILSKMLKYDFLIVDGSSFTTENVTKNRYDKYITLCNMGDDHYDSIWKKDDIENAGFCQSIIYKLVYERVFGLEDVDNEVKKMLCPNEEKSDPKPTTLKENKGEEAAPLFPYKVAKALDPNQYRNIEFDAWNQLKKDSRLKDWYMGGEDLKEGVKCLVIINGKSYNCHIQKITQEGAKSNYLVFVPEFAEKIVVSRQELRPCPDAKPWPLPYPVSRKVSAVDSTSSSTVAEEPTTSRGHVFQNNNGKRRKNKRNMERNSKNGSGKTTHSNDNNNNVDYAQSSLLVPKTENQEFDENLNIKKVKNSDGDSEPMIFSSSEADWASVDDENDDDNHVDQKKSKTVNRDEWNIYHSWGTLDEIPPFNEQVQNPAPYVLPSIGLSNTPVTEFTQCDNAVFQTEAGNKKVTAVYSKYVNAKYASPTETPNVSDTATPYQIGAVPVAPCSGTCCVSSPFQHSVAQMPEYHPPILESQPPMPDDQPPPMPENHPPSSLQMPQFLPFMPPYPPVVPSYPPVMPSYPPVMPSYPPTMSQYSPFMPENQLALLPHPEFQSETPIYRPQFQMFPYTPHNYFEYPVNNSVNMPYFNYDPYYLASTVSDVIPMEFQMPYSYQSVTVNTVYSCSCAQCCYNHQITALPINNALPINQFSAQPIVSQVNWPVPNPPSEVQQSAINREF